LVLESASGPPFVSEQEARLARLTETLLPSRSHAGIMRARRKPVGGAMKNQDAAYRARISKVRYIAGD
jgi:hypothetical protein